MNRNNLKKYAPEARRDFIRAVTDRASFYGLTKKKTEPITVEGDVTIINGRPFPKKVAEQRKRLEEKVNRLGFDQVMEAVAYTWFNRLVAIRYMELHGYLDHGYRVLSHPEGDVTPEIVEHAEHLDLPGLDKQKVISLKLDGTKESELYRMLLIAQCNALHKAMPFLFEHIGDETELLLPDNLLHSDSLIRTLVKEIPEEDWQEVEIIGWLYQFYISEKKDQVIGKVVKSEDIPAATQLFTPNWIVKYLVQNSLGRQWMATYPNSPLKGRMEYYIEPAEQTPDVQEQLKAITPESLNPEELTLLDPACGSGHILVEAYDLLKAIYQERGYRAKDIPRLILEKNLFGLEIDDRAAQLAAFALMMKARADDRRIFDDPVQLFVLAIQESKGLDAKEITEALNQPIFKGETPPPESLFEELDDVKAPLFSRKNLSEPGHILLSDVAQLIDLFEHGKTLGSLIRVPDSYARKLPVILQRLEDVSKHGNIFGKLAAQSMKLLVEQARLLFQKYHCIVTNPPYMGLRVLNTVLKGFLKEGYSEAKTDLFAAFTVRCSLLCTSHGYIGIMSPHVWMYLSTHQGVRDFVLSQASITCLVELPKSGFKGATVQICAYAFVNTYVKGATSVFIRLTGFDGADEEMASLTKQAISNRRIGWCYHSVADDYSMIPGRPLAYWISDKVKTAFRDGAPLSSIASPKHGMTTFDNERFLRQWHEVDFATIKFDACSRDDALRSARKWFPYRKGGSYRRWFGNESLVIKWQNDGEELKHFIRDKNPNVACGEKFFFREAITWSDVTSKSFAARYGRPGSLFDVKGSSAFPEPKDRGLLLGFMNSILMDVFINILNPTATSQVGDISRVPIVALANNNSIEHDLIETLVSVATADWDAFERSWSFKCSPLLTVQSERKSSIESSYMAWVESNRRTIAEMKRLEEANNRILIEAYCLENEYQPDVPLADVTLTVNPAYRYTGGLSEVQRWTRFRQDTIEELLSYAMGCMMGRYSLDKPGLIYAHSGGEGFDLTQYPTFPADADGIIPITDFEWFEDDAANRLEDFIATAWPKEHLEENLKFIADSLGPNKGERPRETIRRYLSTGFYKHHLQLYKKRPIYWLFSSGKQRAFQCLVYLHRYNEGTLSRLRTEYVIPLSGQMSSRIDQLEGDIAAASSTSHRKKLEKERQTLIKQREELQAFDEQLRHYADQRIKLDLDDGVKVNYGKFGNLLAEVKAICGTKDEE